MTNTEFKRWAKGAIRWFQNQFMIQDWEIHLLVQDQPPDDWERTPTTLGAINWDTDNKIAHLWVSPSRCASRRNRRFCAPKCVLFHELLHLLFEDSGIQLDTLAHHERLVDLLAESLAHTYKPRRTS